MKIKKTLLRITAPNVLAGFLLLTLPNFVAKAMASSVISIGSGNTIPNASSIVVKGDNITIAPGNSEILVVGNDMSVPLLPKGTIFVDGQVYTIPATNPGILFELEFPNIPTKFTVDQSLYNRISKFWPLTIPLVAKQLPPSTNNNNSNPSTPTNTQDSQPSPPITTQPQPTVTPQQQPPTSPQSTTNVPKVSRPPRPAQPTKVTRQSSTIFQPATTPQQSSTPKPTPANRIPRPIPPVRLKTN